jgi:hypothetical protein
MLAGVLVFAEAGLRIFFLFRLRAVDLSIPTCFPLESGVFRSSIRYFLH